MNFPIALQLYSVRDEMQQDFEGTLRKVRELGYDGVEFAGLFNLSPAAVRDMLRDAGLTPVSAHVPFVDMMADPEKVVADYKEIGCAYIAIPYLTPEFRPGAEKFDEISRGAALIGEAASRAGLTLLYHNHDFEFEKLGSAYALDVLYEKVPASLLQTELDTCWVKVAGEDPAAYIRKYSGRAPVVHLKDFAGSKQENMYELIGLDEGKKNADGGFEFRPLGKGVQDFPAILAASQEAGAKWVVVEQDQPSMGLSPMECARVSIEYIKTL